MPRLPPRLILRAHAISPHLATLLPACRDLGSARDELRWIRQHVAAVCPPPPRRRVAVVRGLCERRGRGEPLQYVLGSQPFGHLDIKCRPGVLIPRSETEAWVSFLAELVGRGELGAGRSGLRIVDFCTGTGCIALLLQALLREKRTSTTGHRHDKHRIADGIKIWGFDIEDRAVALARENLASNVSPEEPRDWLEIQFEKADIFSSATWLPYLRDKDTERGPSTSNKNYPEIDILVSNPPYISTRGYNSDTARSVRRYEPKLALVPHLHEPPSGFENCAPEDVFYARFLHIAHLLRPKIAVFEVGDLRQALRVAEMAAAGQNSWDIVEIWRDWPEEGGPVEGSAADVAGIKVPIRGAGEGRVVYLRRGGLLGPT
ncbi:S-adenosyl-L-methionine-dependent methyltransferase [Xylariomycetidae sp. FL2044]|nr:S-adenosyl-L-methionine-dependent methyltransferase [Xylariomycetidae sp. FL2044]